MTKSNSLLLEIHNKLDEVLTLIAAQQKDINKIQRWIAKKDKLTKLVPCSAVITCPADTYEYGEVTIRIDLETWTKIKKGQPMTIQGQGWRVEGMDDDEVVQDHWSFNEKAPGHVVVKMAAEDEPEWWDEAFIGDISECDVVETPVKPKKLRGS